MKTIGLLGGMSWESTQEYYRLINQGVKAALGGLHSAQIVLVSVDFEPIEKLQKAGRWNAAADILLQAARQLEAAGAEAVMICTNTMHKVAPQIEQGISAPLLHIADATGAELIRAGHTRVALLGTAFTMEQEFYKGRLIDKFDLEVLTPNARDRQIIHNTIYQELCQGDINPHSRQEFLRIVDQLAGAGAQSVILGCTEIGLLLKPTDTDIKLFDTTRIHAACAVDFVLGK